MAGQEGLKEYNIETLYQKYLNELHIQSNFKYVFDYYRVGNQFNKHRFLQAVLFEKYLCTDLCEIINETMNKINEEL